MLSTTNIIFTYLMTVPIFFAIDMVWLGVVAKDFYAKNLGHLLTSNVNWSAAVIFYLFYIFGIVYFAVLPAVDKNSATVALQNGALLGALAYATYDLTNLATLKDWPLNIVIADIIWGMVLTASVSFASYKVALWLS